MRIWGYNCKVAIPSSSFAHKQELADKELKQTFLDEAKETLVKKNDKTLEVPDSRELKKEWPLEKANKMSLSAHNLYGMTKKDEESFIKQDRRIEFLESKHLYNIKKIKEQKHKRKSEDKVWDVKSR